MCPVQHRSDAAPAVGQHAQPSESEVVESTTEQPAAALQDPDPGAPYRPSDVETTTFFDRRDFPPPPYAKALLRRQFPATPVAGQQAAPTSSQWGGEPPRHQAPPVSAAIRPASPVAPLRLAPAERSAPPAGDPRQWASPPRQAYAGLANYSLASTRFGLLNSCRPARSPARGGGKCCTSTFFGLLLERSPRDERLWRS